MYQALSQSCCGESGAGHVKGLGSRLRLGGLGFEQTQLHTTCVNV